LLLLLFNTPIGGYHMSSIAAPPLFVDESRATIIRRLALFVVGCVGVRLTGALVLWRWTPATDQDTSFWQYAVSAFLLGLALNTLRLWLSTEVQLGIVSARPIWWGKMRPVHATVYLLAAVAFTGALLPVDLAWKLMVFDIALSSAYVLQNYWTVLTCA
jgi:hypothetical protein